MRAFASRTHTSRGTLRGWQEAPGFTQAVQAHRRAILDESVGLLTGFLKHSIAGILTIAKDALNPASIRLQAWQSVVRLHGELSDRLELDARLDELTRKIAAIEGERARGQRWNA